MTPCKRWLSTILTLTNSTADENCLQIKTVRNTNFLLHIFFYQPRVAGVESFTMCVASTSGWIGTSPVLSVSTRRWRSRQTARLGWSPVVPHTTQWRLSSGTRPSRRSFHSTPGSGNTLSCAHWYMCVWTVQVICISATCDDIHTYIYDISVFTACIIPIGVMQAVKTEISYWIFNKNNVWTRLYTFLFNWFNRLNPVEEYNLHWKHDFWQSFRTFISSIVGLLGFTSYKAWHLFKDWFILQHT